MESFRIVVSCPTPRAACVPSVSPRRCPRELLSSSNWGVESARRICLIARQGTKLDFLVIWAVMLFQIVKRRQSRERGKFGMRLRHKNVSNHACQLPRTFRLNIPMAMDLSNCEDEGSVPG